MSNKDTLRKTYSNLPDFKIIKLASEDTESLSDDARDVLNEELVKRGIDIGVDELIDLQQLEIAEKETELYCELLQTLPCPKCKKTNTPLNGTTIHTTAAFIFVSHYEKRIEIACPSCLDKKNYRAIITSLLMGWWSILPFGIYRTIKTVWGNSKSIRENGLLQANSSLISFVNNNYVKIKIHSSNKEELELLIKPD